MRPVSIYKIKPLIQNQNNVKSFLEFLGYKVNKNYKLKLRDEKTESTSISPQGTIKDFGSSFVGDLIDLLKEYHNKNINEAVNYIAEFFGVTEDTSKNEITPIKRKKVINNNLEQNQKYDNLEKFYRIFKNNIKQLNKTLKEQFHNDLIPVYAYNLGDIDKKKIWKQIGYDKLNKSFTISFFDKNNKIQVTNIQRVKQGNEIIKWKTYGYKSFIPHQIKDNYVFVVFGIKEILFLQGLNESFIGFQSDAIAKSISKNKQALEIKREVKDKKLILLLDNDESCKETIKPLANYFNNSNIIIVDFEKLLNKRLRKGFDFDNYVKEYFEGKLKLSIKMIKNYCNNQYKRKPEIIKQGGVNK